MARLVVHGGNALHGSLEANGAKNAALPIMAACLLAKGKVTLRRVPNISDVWTLTGILKAMGAPDSAVLRIFLAQGLAVGAIGTGVGLALGALTCWILTRYPFPLDAQVYLIRSVPVQPSAAEFVLTGAVAMLIAAVASFIPAWWASRLTPVEGLRYE